MRVEDLSTYEIIEKRQIPDINSVTYLCRHKKTGARVALVSNDDENKVFYIGFRTTPKDSTGVAHILEHSVLCGSKEFPVKDPFVELVKGSLNTFLNAMTYPDKTVYPVASCNDKDFQNLMHVYLDAVFYPNIYKNESIFRQEGWHYELEGDNEELKVNGVVYNEMKGAFSSPDDVLEREIMNSLYPHTTYGCESGGDPEAIPELTYEEFLRLAALFARCGVDTVRVTGGEPLVRKHDLIKLCEAHPDCAFLCFTNATLIDEEFCQEMIRVKNFIPAISAEGDEAATDGRRGEGTYAKVEAAMDLLNSHGLPFGVSICYTHDNAPSVASDEYFDWLIEKGALFAWIFTYMPVGKDAPTSLMPTPEDRERLYRFNRRIREIKPILTLDFQHDGEFVGGCIAGGRRYLHINAAGDVEPCVFIHYSDSNIREKTLLEALCSPLFMAYHDGQPFNENHLRPCPMLENPEKLREMVHKSGAHPSDVTALEDVDDLCAKCDSYAENWAPTAAHLWDCSHNCATCGKVAGGK